MPLLQNITLWQSLAMLCKLEVCFDQLSWAIKYRFSADPWELAGEQLLEFRGQKPNGVAGTGLGLPVPVSTKWKSMSMPGVERKGQPCHCSHQVPQQCPNESPSLHLYKPFIRTSLAVPIPSVSAEKNRTKSMGRVQHMELGQQMLVCKRHFM